MLRGVRHKLKLKRASRAHKKGSQKPIVSDKYTTAQYLKMTGKLAKLTLVSFWQRHKVATRLIALFLVALILFSIFYPIYKDTHKEPEYDLSQFDALLDEPVELYAEKLQYNAEKQQYRFNEGYTAASGEVGGQSGAPKVTAIFSSQLDKSAVTLTDPVNSVDITFTPKFGVAAPKKSDNRVVYPIKGKNALKVYTLKGSGVKEDIILKDAPRNDTMEFEYEVTLGDGVELRAESDGSLAAYGVESTLLGNVSTGTEADAELLEKARQNGEKNNLIFTIPAPFIVEAGKKQSSARAWFSVEGTTVTLYASGLKSASYPLSIDPTIYVETARKLMRGNNETNVDFDTTNELIQKSQTTGARIDGWVDSTDMTSGLWDQSTATAGGFIYRAGGKTDPTMPYIVGQQSTVQASDSLTFAMNMPTIRPAGDLYVALIAKNGNNRVTPPAGWTEYADLQQHAAYYKEGTDQGGGNEAASYTWTVATTAEQWTGVIVRIKGFNAGSPITGTAGTGDNGGAAGVPLLPNTGSAPTHDASLIIRAVGINSDVPSDYTWLPNGHTKIFSGTSTAAGGAATAGLVSMTLDQPPLATNSPGTTSLVSDGILNDTYGASTIAIRPATVSSGYQSTVEWAQFNSSTLEIDSPNAGNGVCSGWCSDSVYALPANRVGMSMVAYNGFLYALGGTPDGTAANATTTVWVAKLGANGEPQLWHPSVGTPAYWFVSANVLPAALSYASIAAYNNKLYLSGGRSTAGASINEVRVADLLPTGDIGPWSTTGMQDLTTPGARFGHSLHIYNNTMYIIGGNSGGSLLSTVYLSRLNTDGTMNAWVQTSSFTTGRTSFGGQMTSVWGAYIYLAGGCTALTSGYCSTIASDVQLASINADGSLAPWNPILTLTNQRIGYSFIAWQNGLYRLGGCNRQNTSTGACYATHQNVEYGLVNPAGDASTVSNSEPSGSGTCITPTFINCDLPPAGDGAGQGGQMSSMVVVNNGFIYNIGGCVVGSSTCDSDMSGNISYAALNSTGQMIAPTVCPHTTYGLWCVDSTNRINGTAGLGAAGIAVFNNMIYVAGGTNSGTWQSNFNRVLLNADGSLVGPWQTQTFTSTGLSGTADDARGYMYMFTRANPASAGTNPGNLYMLGGCSGTGGIGCSTYFTETIKCNIQTSGIIASCTTTGQLQIDADNNAAGNQGLGLMAGTVYANRVYLVGGSCAATGAAGNPCGSTYAANRKDTIYAAIDSSNNIVAASGGVWQFTTAQMSPVRRRAVSFGYNGYIYSLAGYSGSASLQDLLFAKINVSTGDISNFDSSGVVVTPRWDLRAIVSNGYVYALGGCGAGAAPGSCSSMQAEVQTFQLYNNDSGTPVNYAASANQFTTDRLGASSTIMNGYLYVAGGCTSTTDCTTAIDSVQYAQIDINGALGAWSAGGNLPAVRTWGQLENAGGTLYYIGGQDSTATNESATVYYTSSVVSGNPTWATATNGLPAARTKHSASVWDNRIYVTGGLDGSAVSQATTYVSPKLSSGGDIGTAWTSTTSFNVARSSHTTIAYANNLYVIGGYDGTNFMNDVQYASIGYKTGTIQQSGTSTITGTGTAWTSAMIGSTLQYRDGEIATILTVPSGTSMTVTVTKTVTAGSGYTILDGSISTWSYTTSLPEAIAGADGFAANGYMYLVGGRNGIGDCVPNTLQAPISANTTIATGNNATGVGEWYETNVKYAGERYGNTVSYANGKLYTMGGACDSAPSPVNVLSQSFDADTTTHNVTMPATVDVGDLLIVFFTNDGNATVTTPAGWTAPGTSTALGNTNQVRGSVFVKDAAGTEDGTNVDFATSATERAAAQVYRIPAAKWDGTITNVEVASLAIAGTTAAPDPPSLNPAGWATENTLWFSYAAGSTHASVTTFPTSHMNGYHTNTATTTTAGASASVTQRINAVAAEDPGAYTMPSAQASSAFTVGVRPASGASNLTYTGANRAVQTALYSQPQVASYSRLIDTDTDVFPTSWLMNGLDNSIGAQWQAKYRSMHDLDSVANPLEDCGTTLTMPVMSTWGRETNYGNVSLGDVATYVARNGAIYTAGTITQSGTAVTGSGTSWGSDLTGGVIFYADNTQATIVSVNSTTSLTVSASKTIGSAQSYSAGGGNINCARYFYFSVTIDASQTFGYPEDVNRGPTIADLSLFFTADPTKRLRHGKTFTGGEQQPLDTPCRQTVDAQCPLP